MVLLKKVLEKYCIKGKKNRQNRTKVYFHILNKDIKSKSVNGGFWRRLKYVGFDYEQQYLILSFTRSPRTSEDYAIYNLFGT